MSEYKEYVILSKKETSLLLKLILIFTILYTFHATLLLDYAWYQLLIPVFIWYALFIIGQFYFHKFCAYKQAFEIEFVELSFNRFHLETQSRLTTRRFMSQPIDYTLISITIAVLSIGFIIFPTVYSYTHKKIDHLFFGKRKLFEFRQGNLYPQENTNLRQSYAFFFSNLYPILWIIVLAQFKHIDLFQMLLVMTITHAFFNLIPLLPHIGFKYFISHIYLWTASFTLLLIFSLFALFFTSFTAFLIVSFCCAAIILAIQFVRFTNSI